MVYDGVIFPSLDESRGLVQAGTSGLFRHRMIPQDTNPYFLAFSAGFIALHSVPIPLALARAPNVGRMHGRADDLDPDMTLF